jgi:hypothetical protein
VLGLLQNALSSQGLATEKFRKKFRGIDSEWLRLFRRRTCSFRGIPRFTEESIWKLGTEENGMKKISVTKNFAPANRKDSMFFPRHASEQNSESLLLFFSMERNSEYFSPLQNDLEWYSESFLFPRWFRMEFREFASIFLQWYRIPSIFLLCGMVHNGIPRIFCSAEQPEFRRFVFRGIIFKSEIANPILDPL